MDIVLPIIFALIGLWLTIIGGRILFSNKALDRMYEKGYWKIDKFMGEKYGRRFDRGRAARIFGIGLIMLLCCVIALWFELTR